MLFILFDIEVVFMYPWAVVYREMLHHEALLRQAALLHHDKDFHQGLGIFGSMFTFIGILFVGFLYALKKKAFDWTQNPGSFVPPVPLLDAEQTPAAAKLH
jgi:NADH-quinone oxidoreductase subunit A